MQDNMKDNQIIEQNDVPLTEQETLNSVRGYIIAAQKQVYTAVNSAMVAAYWNIGKQIYLACGENERAGYGKQLLKYLSEELTAEFGKGFDERNLRSMRQFYVTFQIGTHCVPN